MTSVLGLLLIWMPSQDVCEILHIVNYQQVLIASFSQFHWQDRLVVLFVISQYQVQGFCGCILSEMPKC